MSDANLAGRRRRIVLMRARDGIQRAALEALEGRVLLSAAQLALPAGHIPQAAVERAVARLTTTGSRTEFLYPQAEKAPSDPTPQTDISGPLINLDDFRADTRFSGVDGSGFAAVIIDTGIDKNHPFFGPDSNSDGVSDRIVYSYDFSGSNDPDASDVDGHGSNVSSIVASSNSTYKGMAPGVNIIHLKVFPDSGGGAATADIEEALQWVVANAATYNIVSVNLSLGSGNYGYTRNDDSWSDEFAALVSMNVIPVVAAGNGFYENGSAQGVASPACDPNVIAVGAVYDSNAGSNSYTSGAVANSSGPDVITPFTQRHPILMQIMAPGAPITGANQSGGTVTYHGTSQAAPHVTGIVALAQQLAVQRVGRRLSMGEMRKLLADTAVMVNDGDNENDNVANTGLNFPRVDVQALGNAIYNMAPGSISGVVFNDQNGDGIRSGEPGLAGWTVYLDSNNNGALDTGVWTVGSGDVPKTISDRSTLRSALAVSATPGLITDVNVQVNISHSYDSNLDVYLISPSGTRTLLFADVGSRYNNFSGTVLDDEASQAIGSGSAPFAGNYRPEEVLSRFDGENPNGTWKLEVGDDTFRDTGSLTSWSLILSCAERSQVTPAGGAYSFTGLPAGAHTVRELPQSEWNATAPTLPNAYAITLSPAQVVVDRDFGNQAGGPPVASGLAAVTVNEDAAPTVVDLWAAFADSKDADSALGYSVTSNSNPALFAEVSINSVTGGLTLSYAADNFGAAALVVRATDTDGLWVETTLAVTVNPVNDAPYFAAISDQNVEASGPQQSLAIASVSTGGANEEQSLLFTAVSSDPGLIPDPVIVYASPGSSGTLKFTPEQGLVGSATITVTLQDDGGTGFGGVDRLVRTFDINVADTIAPRVAGEQIAYQGSPHKLIFGFSEPIVSSDYLAALTLTDRLTGLSMSLAGVTAQYDEVARTLTYSFVGVLPDGRYRATLSAANLPDPSGKPLDGDGNGTAGDNHVFDFFILRGDADRDATVGFADLVVVAQNYNTPSGATWATGDFNGDGAVDFADLVAVSQNYNTTLPEPPAAADVPGGGLAGGGGNQMEAVSVVTTSTAPGALPSAGDSVVTQATVPEAGTAKTAGAFGASRKRVAWGNPAKHKDTVRSKTTGESASSAGLVMPAALPRFTPFSTIRLARRDEVWAETRRRE